MNLIILCTHTAVTPDLEHGHHSGKSPCVPSCFSVLNIFPPKGKKNKLFHTNLIIQLLMLLYV